MSKKQKTEMFEDPELCPFCNSKGIERSNPVPLNLEDYKADVACRDCGGAWIDTFKWVHRGSYRKGSSKKTNKK